MKRISARVGFGSQKECEKRLGQILCISRRVTAATDKAVDWRPIRLAQLSKSLLRLRYMCERRLRDDTPMRRGKICAPILESSRPTFHAPRITKDSSLWQSFAAVAADQ